MDVISSSDLARRARISALQMTSAANASHIGSGLSVMDVLAVLYSGGANVTPNSITDPFRDRIIVSKGHAAAAVYSVLAHSGFFDVSLLDDYCKDGSSLGGHVTSHGVNGVEFSTGSLGHGLPLGVGVAISHKRGGRSSQVFVVSSDGELDEGTTWESALLASHNKLNNLTLIIDRNGLQSLTTTEDTLALEPLDKKFEAFGWKVFIVDGHDHASINEVLSTSCDQPKVIIATTIKGKGVSFMENEVLWHYRPASSEQLKLAIEEIESGA